MPDIKDLHTILRTSTLEAYRDEYKEHSETWRSLETKAQGNIAVAGIFIAGSLAYLTKQDLHLRCHEAGCLLVALVCLIVSVILSILTLKTRTITPPPLGSFVDHYTTHLVKIVVEPVLQTRLPSFFSDQVREWRKVIGEVRESNEAKARYLWIAQRFLIAAILGVAALSLSKLILG